MKKIILWFLFIVSIFFIYLLPVNAAVDNSICPYDENLNVKNNLEFCLVDSNKLVQPVNWWWELKINWWFKETILKWVKNISIFLSLMAVWSIVYWALLLTISTGEDEKIKKAKDTVKWWMIWFLAIISAWWLIAIIIELVYKIAPK